MVVVDSAADDGEDEAEVAAMEVIYCRVRQ